MCDARTGSVGSHDVPDVHTSRTPFAQQPDNGTRPGRLRSHIAGAGAPSDSLPEAPIKIMPVQPIHSSNAEFIAGTLEFQRATGWRVECNVPHGRTQAIFGKRKILQSATHENTRCLDSGVDRMLPINKE